MQALAFGTRPYSATVLIVLDRPPVVTYRPYKKKRGLTNDVTLTAHYITPNLKTSPQQITFYLLELTHHHENLFKQLIFQAKKTQRIKFLKLNNYYPQGAVLLLTLVVSGRICTIVLSYSYPPDRRSILLALYWEPQRSSTG